MESNQPPTSRRLARRSLHALFNLCAVIGLTAFAVPGTRADVVHTIQTNTGQHWVQRTVTFTPAYSAHYTLGFNLTAGGPSGDNAILIDAVKVTWGGTTLFGDGFETPELAANTGSASTPNNTLTIGNWAFSNYSGILDGSPPNWGLAGAASNPPASFTLGSADGTTQYAYLQAHAGTSSLGKMKALQTLPLVGGQTYTISYYQASRYDFGGVTTYTVTLDAPVPTVYASGITPVIAWDPIFGPAPVPDDGRAEGKPVPTVGYSAAWSNPHYATFFAKNSHPWENHVPYHFDANWINAWSNMNSNGHGFTVSSPAWNVYPHYRTPNQSWTKYSTMVMGSGSHVLQFLADNASWIYVNGALVGVQDYSWATNGTGRYTIQLNGAGPHELSFVIWDGGGLAGGKFRLETTASFQANNPGVPLPPAPASVTLGNLTHTYDGSPKAATVGTVPGGLTTLVTYNGATTAPTAAGSYNVVATVTSAGYSGSATATLTINKAPATITLDDLQHTYDGTVKSATATTTPSGLNVVINYGGPRISAGSYSVQAILDNSNYAASPVTRTLDIAKASAVVNVSGYSGTYDAAAHGATGTAKGVNGVDLSAQLDLGNKFTDAPGGTATWKFTGGTNYHDATGTAAIEIAKANAAVVVAPYSVTYDGAPHSATVTSITGVNGETGATVGTVALDTTHTDAGTYTDSWSFTGSRNYTDTVGTITDTIAKADAVVTVTGYTGIYDAAPHGATGSAIGVGRTDLSSGLSFGAPLTNAPGGLVSWAFSGGRNYNDQSGTVAIVIHKATANVTVNGYTGVYDGNAHGATGSATGVNGVNLNSGLNLGASFVNVPGGTATWKFTGGTNYNDATGTVPIEITKASAVITVTGYNVTYDGQPHTATGSAIGVKGETLAGLNLAATTHTNAGTTTDAWAFTDTTGNYNNDGGSVTNVIAKAATKTALAAPSVQALGQPVTLTATVTTLTPVAGSPVGTVTFTWGTTVLGSAQLNASGVAVLTTTVLPLGPQSIVATYGGSSNFIGSASSAASVLIYGYPAGGGTFVIGDGNATVGATVNFWGSQWEKNNSLSGGASKADFKGFAVGPTPPVAGGTFTAASGNSGPSPASVPTYLGVIVTSKVTKSGANTTGTITRLVVVKTNPGYAGNVGSTGTGTVVAVIP